MIEAIIDVNFSRYLVLQMNPLCLGDLFLVLRLRLMSVYYNRLNINNKDELSQMRLNSLEVKSIPFSINMTLKPLPLTSDKRRESRQSLSFLIMGHCWG